MSAGSQDEQHRSTLSRVVPVLVAISVIGFLVLMIGDLAGAEGAEEREEGSAVWDIAGVSFSLGAFVALVLAASVSCPGAASRA